MSYVVVGNRVIDSGEILKHIEENFECNAAKDLTKGSKRDDTLVYQIFQDANILKEEIKLQGVSEDATEEEIIEEMMSLADENLLDIEEFIPEGFIYHGYSYHYDEGKEEIKSVVVAIHQEVGEARLKDVINRILNSLD
ncbi:MAG: hypothetical protein JJT76_00940 [Clostridiaceae bacterium]|nr:hypothetical protein [Clostridiaceae bacterium]